MPGFNNKKTLFQNGYYFIMLLFASQTYPEEERPCLSKYWKIYFPDREISLALFLDYSNKPILPYSR